MGDLAVRPAIPYAQTDESPEKTKVKYFSTCSDAGKVLLFPSICTALLIVISCRASHAATDKAGRAKSQSDRDAFDTMFTGLLTNYPKNISMDIRCDAQATRYVDNIIGEHPTTVHPPCDNPSNRFKPKQI